MQIETNVAFGPLARRFRVSSGMSVEKSQTDSPRKSSNQRD
jgi:hypothetical protein